MLIKLNDDEIREALAAAMEKKLEHCISVVHEDCYFEAEAGSVDVEIDDIHNVRFCYDATTLAKQ